MTSHGSLQVPRRFPCPLALLLSGWSKLGIFTKRTRYLHRLQFTLLLSLSTTTDDDTSTRGHSEDPSSSSIVNSGERSLIAQSPGYWRFDDPSFRHSLPHAAALVPADGGRRDPLVVERRRPAAAVTVVAPVGPRRPASGIRGR